MGWLDRINDKIVRKKESINMVVDHDSKNIEVDSNEIIIDGSAIMIKDLTNATNNVNITH